MRVRINEVTGLAAAMTSLLMSKRSYTREKEDHIYDLVKVNTSRRDGKCWPFEILDDEFIRKMDSLITWGVYGSFKRDKLAGHTTLLRFIDLTVTVEGLHRYGQDDLDSHAKRMDSRIVRSSTRLATFEDGEKSDYYKGKILYPFEAMEKLGIKVPEVVSTLEGDYVKTDFGYVREDLQDEQDAKRGLYPGAIPSNFTFKIQYPEFCHIYNHRNFASTANPEVKECVESIARELKEFNPWLYAAIPYVRMQSDLSDEVKNSFKED